MNSNCTYAVHMNCNGFKSLFVAQNGKLQRVAGVFLAVVGALVLLPLASLGYLFKDLGLTLLFLALMVFGIVFAVRPQMALAGRKGVVYNWFSKHGCTNASAMPLSSLECDYRVSIEDYGYVESSASPTNRIPWFVLSGKTAKVPGGVCFLKDQGKDGSVIYNAIGINWAFRNEDMNGLLFVPNDAATPELLQTIASCIKESRSTYTGRAGRERAKHDEGLAEWILGSKSEWRAGTSAALILTVS